MADEKQSNWHVDLKSIALGAVGSLVATALVASIPVFKNALSELLLRPPRTEISNAVSIYSDMKVGPPGDWEGDNQYIFFSQKLSDSEEVQNIVNGFKKTHTLSLQQTVLSEEFMRNITVKINGETQPLATAVGAVVFRLDDNKTPGFSDDQLIMSIQLVEGAVVDVEQFKTYKTANGSNYIATVNVAVTGT